MIACFLGTNNDYLTTLAESFKKAETVVLTTNIDHLIELTPDSPRGKVFIVIDGTMLRRSPNEIYLQLRDQFRDAFILYFYNNDSDSIISKLNEIGFDKVITSKEQYLQFVLELNS